MQAQEQDSATQQQAQAGAKGKQEGREEQGPEEDEGAVRLACEGCSGMWAHGCDDGDAMMACGAMQGWRVDVM